MKLEDIAIGLRVKIMTLGDTKGMFIKKEHLDVRKIGVKGTVIGYVSGHGGDIWWIKHDNGQIGAYVFDEFEKG